MATKPAPKAEAPAEAPPKSRTLLVMVVVAVLVALAGGGGAAWYFVGQGAPTKAAPPTVSTFLPIEQFTVNLQPEEGNQFLQVSLTVQLSREAKPDMIKARMPDIRNRILLLLSSQRASQLIGTEAKKKLADEIAAEIRRAVAGTGGEVGIEAVLYTAFIIQ